jgi:hypothetical protein
VRQLYLLEDTEAVTQLDARLWHGSFNSRESTLQQLSPYVGKMKSGMARVLISLYTKPGDIVLDPFSGSGVVPLEAVLAGRCAWANDLSPYAYVLTRGKLETPGSGTLAIEKAKVLIDAVEQNVSSINLATVPEWVREFFHPDTLREVLAAFYILRQQPDCFLTACLLGILHHVRPGLYPICVKPNIRLTNSQRCTPTVTYALDCWQRSKELIVATCCRLIGNSDSIKSGKQTL